MYEPRAVHFERPPVAEVALALQTAPIPGLTSAHLGLFWDQTLRHEYPVVQEQPAAPPVLDAPDLPIGAPQILFGPLNIGVRHWYLSADETRIVQLQQDRLIVNWRKLSTTAYPRYGQLRRDLELYAVAWREFLEQSGFPPPPVAQVEVTYVNQVASLGEDGNQLAFDDVFRVPAMSWPAGAGTLETTQVVQQFLVGEPPEYAGRLHLQIGAVSAPSAPHSYNLNLTFRGKGDSSLDGSLSRLDIGHNQVINTFRDITTTAMHRYWQETT